jgi:hypothetical protein
MARSLSCISPVLLLSLALYSACTRPSPPEAKTAVMELEIPLPDSTVAQMCLSPANNNRVWVAGADTCWEIDLQTGHSASLLHELMKVIRTPSHGILPFCTFDRYDSCYWFGVPNQYLYRWKITPGEVETLHYSNVTVVAPAPDAVYLVSNQGFLRRNRATGETTRVPNVPSGDWTGSWMLNDTTLVLCDQYTFFTRSGKIQRGTPPKPAARQSLRADGSDIHVILPSGHSEKTPCFLRPISYSTFNIFPDTPYIWMWRPGQVALYHTVSKQIYEYLLPAGESFLSMFVRPDQVFLLYHNKLVIKDKLLFIQRCTAFHPAEYKLELEGFYQKTKDRHFGQDTTWQEALQKLNQIKKEYAVLRHEDIQRQLAQWETSIFSRVHLKYPQEYMECYQNTDLPLARRKSCLVDLIIKANFQSDFRSIVRLEKTYRKYFGAPGKEEALENVFSTTRQYLHTIDSLAVSDVSADSMAFCQALALELICTNRWHCGEGCSGCNFDLLIRALEQFVKKYPDSKLADNAAWLQLDYDYRYLYEYGPSPELRQGIRQAERILSQYPHSDVAPEVLYFLICSWDNYESPAQVRKLAKQFFRQFPGHPHTDSVEDIFRKQSL